MAKKLIAFGCLAVLLVVAGFFGFVYWAFGPKDPPPITGNVTCVQLDEACRAANAAFEKTLHQRFPVGSPAKTLEAELMAQGFEHEPETGTTRCLPEGESAPDNKPYATCPAWDAHWNPRNLLITGWGHGFGCNNVATVVWSADAAGRITHLEGGIDYRCI